ncbi:MAG: FecR family protein [bacterium]
MSGRTWVRVILLLLLVPQRGAAAELVGYLAEFSDVVYCPRDAAPLRQSEKPRDLHFGDAVITRDAPERSAAARVFLADRQTIAIAGNSELVISGVDTPDGMRSTSVRLNSGRIRVYVSPGAHCQVETPAAVVTCRHTDFVVAVDASTHATDVVVIDGIVEVRGVGPGADHPVTVLPYQMLHVAVGGPAGQPSVVGDAARARYSAGLDLIGDGTSERLEIGQRLADGSEVLTVDRPDPPSSEPWEPGPRQEQPGTIANPLFGVPGNLIVDY